MDLTTSAPRSAGNRPGQRRTLSSGKNPRGCDDPEEAQGRIPVAHGGSARVSCGVGPARARPCAPCGPVPRHHDLRGTR